MTEFKEPAQTLNSPTENSSLLTARQAADYLGLQPRTVNEKARAGKIGYVRDGRHGRFRYRLADLDAYVEANTVRGHR